MQSAVEQTGDGNHDITCEDLAFAAAQVRVNAHQEEKDKYFRRLIEQVRTLYRKDDLTALSPLGEVEPLALPGESYKLAFTPALLTQVFKRRRDGQPDEDLLPDPASVLEGAGADQGGYVNMEGSWWIPSGRIFYSPDTNDDAISEREFARQHFFLPHRFRDPFGQPTYVLYDSNDADPRKSHNLLVVKTQDVLGNTVTADNDIACCNPGY
jgi:hypothetical protein